MEHRRTHFSPTGWGALGLLLVTTACGAESETEPVASRTGSVTAFDAPRTTDDLTQLRATFATSTIDRSTSTFGRCTHTHESVIDTSQQDAGDVTVRAAMTVVETSYDGSAYRDTTVAQSVWDPGDEITFSGTGATVPAFAVSVEAPAPITLVSPRLPDDVRTINRSRDLTFTWTTGGSVGTVDVGIQSSDDSSRVHCAFPADAGEGTVHAAALALLPAGTGVLTIFVNHTEELELADDWTVTVTAATTATDYREPARAVGSVSIEVE